MIKCMLKMSVTAIAFLVASAVSAQPSKPVVTARIDKDSIMIGDRFTLEVEVEKDQVQTVIFPAFRQTQMPDSLAQMPPVECIEELQPDTVSREGRKLVLRKKYIMAAFDEGVYNLGRPGVLYADKNIVDTLYSADSLHIAVATFQIDSTSHAIFDIKPQKTLPFRFGEISGYLLWVLIALLIVGAAIYGLVLYLRAHGRKISDLFKPAPPLPAHVVAIEALEALHNQKLWQNNRHKEYYSALSDILRTYISGRYGVGAMEMTTDQLIEAMYPIEMPQKSNMDMVTVLRDSDLVKFAKFMPDAEQNEADYHKAYFFVEETKPVEEVQDEAETLAGEKSAPLEKN